MKKKVLILGAEGMVGRCVYKFFVLDKDLISFGTSRTKKNKYLITYNFPEDNKNLEKFLSENTIDFIINCIGIIKGPKNTSYKTNYQLPKFLNRKSKKYKFRVIQISSDAVFKDSSKNVSELDKPKPDSNYGKSKLMGEIYSNNFLNVRTSLIGYDSRGKNGLLEWLMNNNNKEVKGYVNQIWNGSTTLQFAKFCKYLITKNNFDALNNRTKVIHFAPLGPLTKYELLKSFSFVLKLKKEIIEKKSHVITRNLYSVYFDRKSLKRYTTEANSALLELKKFEST